MTFQNGHDSQIRLPNIIKLGNNIIYLELMWCNVLPNLQYLFQKILLGYIIVMSISDKECETVPGKEITTRYSMQRNI